MDTRYRGAFVPPKSGFSHTVMERLDFTGTRFHGAVLEDVQLRGCLFDGTDVRTLRPLGKTTFEACVFRDLDLRSARIGSRAGPYRGCTFERCDFRDRQLSGTVFEDCVFDDCDFRGARFDDTRLSRCRFIGELANVRFIGPEVLTEDAADCLHEVDFSHTRFAGRVVFQRCGIATCIAPGGTALDALVELHPDDGLVIQGPPSTRRRRGFP